jgi:hypothetical protein
VRDKKRALIDALEADSEAGGILADMFAEFLRASATFNGFHSAHEGYAVLREEVDELWDDVKANAEPDRLREEAVQVGAMAVRFVHDVCRAK